MKADSRLLLLLAVGIGIPASSIALDPKNLANVAEALRTGGVVLVMALVVWWLLGELDRRDEGCRKEKEALLNDLHTSRGEERAVWEKRVDDLVKMQSDYQTAIEKLRG